MEAITEKSGNIATVVGSGPSRDPSNASKPLPLRPRGWPFAGGCSYRVSEWSEVAQGDIGK